MALRNKPHLHPLISVSLRLDRDRQVVQSYADGGVTATFGTVGEKLGLSSERARQIVVRWERDSGQRIPRAFEPRRSAREAAKSTRNPLTLSLAQRLLSNARPGVSVRVRTRLCRTCDHDRHRRPPLSPKLHANAPWEQSIRRVENAKLADRPRVLERELQWTAPFGIPPVPDEPWDSYRQRIGDTAHVDVWLSSRLIQHGRIREALAECPPASRE